MRVFLSAAALITLILVASVATHPWTLAKGQPEPTSCVDTGGVFCNWHAPCSDGCTWSGPVDVCAQELHITFPMTDEATRQRYFTCAPHREEPENPHS